jgi:hypothetical protein
MSWSQMTPMRERTLFIADHLRGTRSVIELCAEHGISRKTGYKLIERFIRQIFEVPNSSSDRGPCLR